jgi:rhodanese-related sulfurtransferase
MAAIAGDPQPRRIRAQVDMAALAGVIEREEDHVTAIELAEWIRDRKRGLRVADIRTRDEFERYHIPSAELLALSDIPKVVPAEEETWVLYSEGGAHAAQAWMLMRAMGHERVYFLRGGVLDWAEDVMNPVLLPASTADARRQNERIAEVSRYFGGVPRTGDPAKVARFDSRKVEKLLQFPGIVRNRLKVASAITNARCFLEVQSEFGSFARFSWQFVGGKPVVNRWREMNQVPATSPANSPVPPGSAVVVEENEVPPLFPPTAG